MDLQNTSGRVIYSDRDNEELIRQRKRDLRFSYVLVSLIVSVYSFAMAAFVFRLLGEPIQTVLFLVVLSVVTVSLAIWGFQYAVFKPGKNALRSGVTLTREMLTLPSRRIPVSDIERVTLEEMGAPPRRVLKIRLRSEGRKLRISTLLIKEKSTASIQELYQRLRDLKTLEGQSRTPDLLRLGTDMRNIRRQG